MTDRIGAEGVILRPWSHGDVPMLMDLVDYDEMDWHTAAPPPLTAESAAKRVDVALAGPAEGVYDFAITAHGDTPVGEIMLFPRSAETCEFSYAVGRGHRGHGYAAKAVRALLPLARSLGYRRATLTISDDNAGSIRTAQDAGFAISDLPLYDGPGKKFFFRLAVWVREL